MESYENCKFEFKDVYLYSKNRKKEKRSNDILTFDIETTQLFKPRKKWIVYDYNIPEKEYSDCPCLSFPYIWQFGFNEKIFYGRNWNDCKKFFEKLNSFGIQVVVYVHNLSFEFAFLRNLFNVKKVFARKAHSIIYAIFEEIENLTFRCSYFLTRLSLEDWGKRIQKETGKEISKKSGDLDYNKFRTEHTRLTKKEMLYCEYDCLVMYYGLLIYLEKYGRIHDIPLTQTGEVRKKIREVSKECGFNKKALKLQPQSYDEYVRLLNVTRGGDSHANYIYCDSVLKNIMCLDYTSSYPFSMCTKKVPMSKFHKSVYSKLPDMGYIMLCKFRNLESKINLHYIPKSKCLQINGYYSCDNGRIINADEIYIWLIDLDLEVIKDVYDYDLEIIECYSCILDYMPKDIVYTILQYFKEKTNYKDVPGFENIYLCAKQFINSIYGMSITKLVQDTYLFNDNTGEYNVEILTKDEREDKLKKQLMYASKNPLHYGFGLWTVTNSRKMLWDGFGILGYDNIAYYDTDSYKGYFDMENVDKINSINMQYMLDMQKRYGFSDDLVFPKNPKGDIEVLGRLTVEKPYKTFKTLGAKKYVYEQDDGVHITVAGLPKKAKEALTSIDDFCDEWYVPPKLSHKFRIKYQEEQPTPIIKGYKIPVKKSAVLIPCGFTNNIADEFINLINGA